MPSATSPRRASRSSSRDFARSSGVFGRLAAELEQRVVLEDPRPRHVAALRQRLAQPRQLAQRRDEPRRGRARPDPGPGVLRVEPVGRRVGQHRQLLGDPGRPPGLLEPLRQRLVDASQVGDVGQRIGHLRRAERPMAPVGEARRLVDRGPRHLPHQRLVADLVAVAADHRRHLGVEERLGQHAGGGLEDLEVLPRRVEHLHDVPVAEQLVERVEPEPVRQRVDQHRALVALARPGELHQAELGVVGALAQELGVDGDVRVGRRLGAEGGQRVGLGDQLQGGAPAGTRIGNNTFKSDACRELPRGDRLCGTMPRRWQAAGRRRGRADRAESRAAAAARGLTNG